eukprot:scaffold114164_cov32-Phaeocystis_antarctica.AAC.2
MLRKATGSNRHRPPGNLLPRWPAALDYSGWRRVAWSERPGLANPNPNQDVRRTGREPYTGTPSRHASCPVDEAAPRAPS